MEKLSEGPRVQRSSGPKVPGSQGPRYLKLTFKYELDSKEGPSCFFILITIIIDQQIKTVEKIVKQCKRKVAEFLIVYWGMKVPG